MIYSDLIRKTPGLIGYWPLNELAGAVAFPLAGAIGGAYTAGPTLGESGALGDFSPAVGFDGVDDLISVAGNPGFDASELTVEMWVLAAAVQSNTLPRLIDRVGGSNGNLGFRVLINNAPPFPITFAVYVGPEILRSQSTSSVMTEDVWHHVLCSYDQWRIAVNLDGALLTATSFSTGLPMQSTTAQPVSIANNGVGGTRPLTGRLAHVALYSRGLSTVDAATHYFLGLVPQRVLPHFNQAMVVTPSDTVNGPFPNADQPAGWFRGLYARGAGNIAVVGPDDAVSTLAVPAGTFVPVMGKRVNFSGTSATGLGAFRRV